ncbi:MAG: Hypothetical protein AJITA_00772 [Acetilactobacillus jinshanensis]
MINLAGNWLAAALAMDTVNKVPAIIFLKEVLNSLKFV